MAAPIIKLKRSAVEGKIPSTANVPLGELALNTYDGYLYASKDVGAGVTVIAINPWRVGTGTDAYNAYFTQGNVGIGSTLPTELLDVSGTIETEQLVVTGVSTFSSNVSFSSDIDSHLIPASDDTYDLGTPNDQWRNLYIDGLANVDQLLCSSSADFQNTVEISGDVKIADKIVHIADTDTAIRFPADDTISFDTAGSERLRVDSDGKIGIGIQSPAYDLDLGEEASTIRLVSEDGGTAIRMGAGDSNSDVTLIRVDGGGGGFHGESDSAKFGFSLKYLGSGTGNANALSVFSDNQSGTQVEAVTVFQDGIVGINSTSPSERLDVGGTTKTEQLNVTGVSTITGNTFFQSNVHLEDNDQLRLGDSNEFKVIHRSAGDSTITSSGAVYVGSTAKVNIASGYNTNFMARFTPAGSAELYYNYNKKFETTASGIDVTGHTETDTLNVSGISTFQGNVHLGDNDQIIMGDGPDLKLYHDGSNSYVEDTGTGALIMKGSTVRFRSTTNENMLSASQNGAISLYHDNNVKLETTASGIDVTGHTETDTLNVSGVSTFQSHIHLGDADEARFGDSNDLKIYHNNNGIILNETGNLIIAANQLRINNSNSSQRMIQGGNGGAVSLWYNGDKKFETTGYGVTVFGTTQTQQLNVTGVSTFAGLVDINAGGQANTFKVEDLTSGRVVLAGTGGELEDSANLTFDGSTLTVNGDVSIGGTLTYEDVTNIDSVGIITARSDVSIADKIVHTGDTDTAIRFPATNRFAVETGGIEALRVDGSQRVGIGTDDLQARFTVYSAANNAYTREIRIDASDAPSGSVGHGVFRILGDGNSLGKYIIGYNSTHPSQANDVSLKNSDGDISFHTASNDTPEEKLRITTTGRIGINESNPAYTLDLGESASTIRLVSENNGTAIRIGPGGDSNDITLIRVDGSSNAHDGESDSAKIGFSLKYMGSRSQNANSFSLFSDNQAGTQVEAVTVFQDGTVGINSTIPSERLDVGGTTKTEQLNVTGVSTFAGKVNADAGLEVSGAVLTANNNIDTYAVRRKGHTNTRLALPADNEISLQNSSGSILRVKDDRVGINSVTPRSELDVRGDVIVTGVSTFQGNVHLLDSDKLLLGGAAGTHDGLEIYHDGSHSYIDDSGTGNLYLRSGTLSIQNLAGSKTSAVFNSGGGQELYHNNSKKFETTASGIDVTGHTETDTLNVSGLSTFVGDISIADKILHTGDTDTAIRFPAANKFTVETAGSEALRVDGDQNVGIGTNDPDTRLDVLPLHGRLRINDFSHIIFNNDNNSTTNYWGIVPRDSYLALAYGTPNSSTTIGGANDIIRVQASNGRVSVGKGEGGAQIYASSANLAIQATSNEVLDDSDGLHDLANPAFLHIRNHNNLATAESGILLDPRADSPGAVAIYAKRTANNLGDLIFRFKSGSSASAERVRITSDGNLGINSTAPSEKLDVAGTTKTEQLNVTGVSTFQGNVNLGDDDQIIFGDGEDLKIYHDGGNSWVREGGTGALYLDSNGSVIKITKSGASEEMAAFFTDGAVELFYDNSKKFETTASGIDVTGHTETDTLNVSGIATAAFYYGDGSNLTGIVASADPGGSDGQIQYNNGGTTGGASQLYYDDSTNRLGIGTDNPVLGTLHINQGSNGFALNLQEGSSANPKILFTNTDGNSGATAIEGDPDSGSGFLAFIAGNSERVRITSGGNLGIGDTEPDHKLHVQGNIGLRDHAVVGTANNVTTTSTTQTAVASISASTHRSVEFLVQATEGTNYHVIKVLVIHDGSTAYNTQYGEMFTNTSVFSLDADISGGNIRLLATSASANSTVYKVSFQSIKV